MTIRKLLIGLLGVVFILPFLGTLVGIKVLQIQTLMAAMGQQGQPPEAVNLGEVREVSWERRVEAVGSVVAVQGVIVAAEADGVVRAIEAEAGAVVKAGQVLVRLDSEVEEAQLRAAEATAEWARVSFKRAQELFGSRTVSQAEVDSAQAEVKQAEAQADNIRAMIAKKTIVAPFAGRLGVRQISLGQFLNKGGPVISLQSLDPVYVEFSVPQQRLGLIQHDYVVRVTSDAFAERTFEGRITAINPDIDPATLNVRVQSTLTNTDGLLRPGMFVAVDVVLPEAENVLAIPTTAVVYAPYGNSVFVAVEGEAGPDGKRPLVAEQRTVRLGLNRGDFVAVTAGLKVGERIVTSGAFKLRQGVTLLPSDRGVTEPQLEPKPADA